MLVIGLASAVMHLVATFLFGFSGKDRMGRVVGYSALAAIAGTMLLAGIAGKMRSPTVAVKSAATGTPVARAVAVLVESRISFVFGIGNPNSLTLMTRTP